MSASTTSDLQCKSILKGLRDLEEVLNRPLANEALNLTENATTSRQKDLLVRLRKSLEQYLERTGNLVYVALIGHFSSGKSSTINSLLNLWDLPSQREVALNPTDKVITLITHDRNANSLLRVVSQGSVPTRIQAIENDLLKDIVLVDTPGTGDPNLIEELARDFLPICDLVLFFFSAASPLDSTDIPPLTELHRRLPFIPLMFVITRADELRIDLRQPVSPSNFDHGKTATFIAEVMSRITLLLQPAKYSKEDFLLIDNKAQYNIDSLRSELLSRVDPANLSNRMTMHSHKVNFFQTTSEALREFFSSFLDAKLTQLNRIVATSEKNILRYQESVNISNNNLTKNWSDQHTAIQEFKIKATERIKSVTALPTSVFDYEPISKLSVEIQSDITRQSGSVAEQVKQYAMQTGFLELQRELSKAQRALTDADLDNLSTQDHGLSPITIEWAFGDTDIIPVHYLARKADDFREKMRANVVGLSADIKRAFEDIQRAIQNRYVIGKCEEIIYTAQSSLAHDLDLYFQNVQVYRAGVFAMTTKASIAKLGIGEELDKIETEFTDEDKESIKIAAKLALFPSFDDVVAAATTKLTSISAQIRSIINSMGSGYDEAPPASQARIDLAKAEQLSALITEVKSELKREANEFIGGMQTKLSGVIGNVLDAYDKDRTAARHARKVRYVTAIGVMGGIALAAYIIYHRMVQPVGQSVLEILGWGILVEFIANLLGFGIARFRDDYPETTRQIKERHNAILNSQIKTAIDDAVKAHAFSILQVSVLGQKLGKIYTSLTFPPSDAWQAIIEEQYRNVRTWISNYQEIRQAYLAVVESFAKDSGHYFEDAQQNLTTLKLTASSIKERAIEPSFTLLARTSEQLQAVKNEITAIRFS